MKLKVIVLAVMFVMKAFEVSGQELLSLSDAIARSLENNHDIIVARNDAQISRNNVHIGNADLLPTVDLVADAAYLDTRLETDAGRVSASSTTTGAQIQLRYTLFDGLGNIYTFKKLKATGRLGEFLARDEIETIVLQVSSVYYDVASANETFDIARESLEISRERLERAQRRANFGQANTIDVLSAQVDLNSDSVAFVNAQLGLNQAKRTLNVLLNRAVQQEFTIDSAVEFQETLNVAAITERALQQNWDYLAAVNRFEQAKLDLGIAKSADYPHLSLYSTYGYDQTTSQFGVALDKPDRNFTAGVTLSLNLFNGFKTGIAKQNARINIDSQALLQEKARLELQEAVANAFEAYQNSRYVLAIEQRNLQSAELNFKRTQELYNLGQATTTTFREAQLNLVQAKNNIANAKFTAKVLEFELLRLSGGLVERHQI